jgi:glucose/mannose-6-phosphate isomerase
VNLDDLAGLQAIDTLNYLRGVDSLPAQLAQAWKLAQGLELPEAWTDVRQVVLAGMGVAGMAGKLAGAYAAGLSPVPIVAVQDDGLPAWVGTQSLLIANCYTGDTEETLTACQAALGRGARLLVITQAGVDENSLAVLAEQAAQPVWRYVSEGQPRDALGYGLALTLGALARLRLIPDPSADLAEAVAALRAQQRQLRAESPVTANPAKRMAGQFMDRMPLICGGGLLAPVAQHWKNQINTVAKAVAMCDALPEMGHNSVAGTLYPEQLVGKCLALFLRSRFEGPRQARRAEIIREIFMTTGFNTDTVEAAGPSPLAHLLTSLHYGDYVAFYLAICYGVDPSPTPQIEYLNEQLGLG